MAPIVKAFKDIYPGIILRILEKKRNELMEAAGHGEFDLVITTPPIDDRFVYETVFVEDNVIATTDTLPAEETEELKFPAIKAEELNGIPLPC